MSKKQKAAHGRAAADATVTYSSMSGAQKFGHVIKICVFFLSFGFAFPNILTD